MANNQLSRIEEAINRGIISIAYLDKVIDDHFQHQIDHLKKLNDSYKKGVDECNIGAVSSNAYFIAVKTKELEASKNFLTKAQEEEIDKLDIEYINNFQRLEKGVCECTPKRKAI